MIDFMRSNVYKAKLKHTFFHSKNIDSCWVTCSRLFHFIFSLFQIVTAMHRYEHSINYTCQTTLHCNMLQLIQFQCEKTDFWFRFDGDGLWTGSASLLTASIKNHRRNRWNLWINEHHPSDCSVKISRNRQLLISKPKRDKAR